MDKEKSIFKINSKILKDKKTIAVIILGLIGIILIIFSNTGTGEKRVIFDEKKYVIELENKLEDILQNIEGVGDCKVMITLESSTEYIYSDVYSNTSPVLLKSLEPTVKGVAVICSGGDNILVKGDVVDTVTSVLNITSARVSVCKKK